ncbi:2Fe-2S iron-sulfur cluster-binding protein [Bordetella pertussis]
MNPAGHEVEVRPQGWRFDARPGESLLRAAARAGIRLPSSCRNGTCRTCLCRLVAGEVAYLVEWPGVSADEKAQGWILPCVAQALAPVAIEAPQATPLPLKPPPSTLLTGARRA